MNAACIRKAVSQLRTDSQRDIFAQLAAQQHAIAADLRTDADSMAYAARALEHVMADVYEEDYPDLPVADGTIMPIDSSVNEGAKTWTYYLYSGTATARIGAQYSDGTLPIVTRTGAEVTRKVLPFENAFEYSTDDMRHAAMAKDNLDSALGALARRGHEQLFHRVGLWGRTELGVDGLLTHPNITIVTAAATGTNSSTEFADKTVDQIIEDFRVLIGSAARLTHGLRTTTRVLMSRRVMELLVTRRLGPGDGHATLLDHLMKVWGGKDPGGINGGVPVEFMILEELDWTKAQTEADNGVSNVDVDEDTGDVLIAYVHNNPKVLRLIRPMPFKQQPVQAINLRFRTPCESKSGGVRLPEPLTICRMEGVYI